MCSTHCNTHAAGPNIETAVLELIGEWTQMDGRLVLSGRDLVDFRGQVADVISGRV